MRRRKASKRGGRAKAKKSSQAKLAAEASPPEAEVSQNAAEDQGSVVDDEPSVVDADGEQSSKDGNGSGTESEKMHTGFMQTGPKSYRCGSTLIELDDADEDITVIRKNNDIALEVECGENQAIMYLSKLYQGSKGQCIEFQGAWITPNEFQAVSGRESAKDWKRSIRHHGRSLKLLLSKGILDVHPAACRCDSCRLLQQSVSSRYCLGVWCMY
ncbi:hypothetical protein BaRGS_00001581 [Batillaria attramentaria]|uniref:SAND domain-containing protein n=1 Tax=Batillaria attramentaria TaxID=370345 RepID=A0ABD0M8F7_9CAEN